MVRTRAQRVINEENGVAQSPPQVLATPIRRTRNVRATRTFNDTVRDAARTDSDDDVNNNKKNLTSSKASESDDSPKQLKSKPSSKPRSKSAPKTKAPPKSKKTAASKTGAKKARGRSAAKNVKTQADNNVNLSTEESDNSTHVTEEAVQSPKVTRSTKRPSTESTEEPSTKRRKGTTRNTRSTKTKKNNTTTSKVNEEIDAKSDSVEKPTSQTETTPPTNAGLFTIFSGLTPRLTTSQTATPSTEEVASVPTDTDKQDGSSIEQEQVEGVRSTKSSPSDQRVLQEHGANTQKPTAKNSPTSAKRKRGNDDHDSEDDLSDAPEVKKKTTRYSFKPNREGNLALLPRDKIDPEDTSVVYIDGNEAARLISQEFERKKQVRFADRIAKQYSELTDEEKAAHRAKLEAQNLQLTTQGLFGNSLVRGGDMRTLARKLDAGNKTMLERIESLSTSNDEDLREDLARDLIELAVAIRAAGPQSTSMSPVERMGSLLFGHSQENKENNSASVSPQQQPLQIEPPPTPLQSGSEASQSNTTPGRLIASIRKIRSFLPFSGATPVPAQVPSPKQTKEVLHSQVSPTPIRRSLLSTPRSRHRQASTAGIVAVGHRGSLRRPVDESASTSTVSAEYKQYLFQQYGIRSANSGIPSDNNPGIAAPHEPQSSHRSGLESAGSNIPSGNDSGVVAAFKPLSSYQSGLESARSDASSGNDSNVVAPRQPQSSHRSGLESAKSDVSSGNDSSVVATSKLPSNSESLSDHRDQINTAQAPSTPLAPKSKLADPGHVSPTQSQSLQDEPDNSEKLKSQGVTTAKVSMDTDMKQDTGTLSSSTKTPASLKRKIGSEYYPLTASGKIPGPAPNCYGLNADYFYNADSSTDSEEVEEIPFPKRRRFGQDGISSQPKFNARATKLPLKSALKSALKKPSTNRPHHGTSNSKMWQAGDPYMTDSDDNEQENQSSSTDNRHQQRVKLRGERLKSAAEAHKPKTPSRLREMNTMPPPPVDVKARLKELFDGRGTQGALNVFVHV